MSTAPDNAPIENFSNCHVGIVSHLRELGRLPALLEPARQARRIAADTLAFFREAVYEHHAEEEKELFPAVMASANADERARVQEMVERLTKDHRLIEARWVQIEPGLKKAAQGAEGPLDGAEVQALVDAYLAHAAYEEEVFLPLAQAILGRNGNHMAALGMSLHLRHALPEVQRRFGFRL